MHGVCRIDMFTERGELADFGEAWLEEPLRGFEFSKIGIVEVLDEGNPDID